jgi:hypothetical protein
LEQAGVRKVFLPGSNLSDIVDWVNDNVPAR